jgi:hypothetical protein
MKQAAKLALALTTASALVVALAIELGGREHEVLAAVPSAPLAPVPEVAPESP